MRDITISVEGERQVGVAEFGPSDGDAVLWCHGGPGCRLEPAYVAERAAKEGWRLIGMDRPGYGNSDPRPGRTITGWVPDALAVADHLGIASFFAAGLSTGEAYALALAAATERVRGTLLCCSVTDMRIDEVRSTMSRPHALAVWEAPDRDAAIAAAIDAHGIDGSKIVSSNEGPPLPPSDQAMLQSAWGHAWLTAAPTMFAHGLQGHADDRIADRPGWVDIDIGNLTCPVIVLHGGADVITTVTHAHHTTALIPGAELSIFDHLGHFSIEDEIIPALRRLRERSLGD